MCKSNGICYINKVILGGKIIGKKGEPLNLVELIRKNGEPVLDKNGNPVKKLEFTVSVIDQLRGKDENGYYYTNDIRCTAFGGTAAFIARNFIGQSGIYIEGFENTSKYEVDGQMRYSKTVVVGSVNFNGTPVPKNEDVVSQENAPEDAGFAEELEDEDLGLPFN